MTKRSFFHFYINYSNFIQYFYDIFTNTSENITIVYLENNGKQEKNHLKVLNKKSNNIIIKLKNTKLKYTVKFRTDNSTK